jgi:hypothetical protein
MLRTQLSLIVAIVLSMPGCLAPISNGPIWTHLSRAKLRGILKELNLKGPESAKFIDSFIDNNAIGTRIKCRYHFQPCLSTLSMKRAFLTPSSYKALAGVLGHNTILHRDGKLIFERNGQTMLLFYTSD